MKKISIIVIGLVIIVGALVYIKNKRVDIDPRDKSILLCGDNGEFCPGTPAYKEALKRRQQENNKAKEEFPNETFSVQPGEVKEVIDQGNGQYIITVDILSPNPQWQPGVDSTGGPFINQSTKIRNLNVTSSTKTFNCGAGQAPDVMQNNADFIKKLESDTYKIRYFDVMNGNITSIYMQCLP